MNSYVPAAEKGKSGGVLGFSRLTGHPSVPVSKSSIYDEFVS